MKITIKITRKDTMTHLAQLHLACELLKLIKHFFPGLVSLLKKVKDPRNQSYITYETEILLMTKILSSIFHIESMRKTSKEFNCPEAIENVKTICGDEHLEQLPHGSTINEFLEWLDPSQLEKIIPKLVNHLLRMSSFEDPKAHGKYWKILIDGTQLCNDTEQLDVRCLRKIHRDKEDGSIRYVEYYYYVLGAKLVVKNNIMISIATEFVENSGTEGTKQDCGLKACCRLMEKLKLVPQDCRYVPVQTVYTPESHFSGGQRDGMALYCQISKKVVSHLLMQNMKRGSWKIRRRKSDLPM